MTAPDTALLSRSPMRRPPAELQADPITGDAITGDTTHGKADPEPAAAVSAEALYNQAFGLLQRASYDKAEVAFRAFLEAYPDDPRSNNARYWIAEGYFARADFNAAAEAFLAAHRANASGGKAAESLLGLGMSQARLGKTAQACETYRELTRAYPDSNLSVRRRADQEKARIGCR